MNTENISTLKIHKLSQEQYDREKAAGRIDEQAIYLTPDDSYSRDEINTKIGELNTSISGKANSSDLTSHINNKSNPHGVTAAQLNLGNVENKSSATIRGEITKSNVTTALGFTPYNKTEVDNLLNGKANSSHQQAASTITVDPLDNYTSSNVQTALEAMETDIQANKTGLNSKVPTSTEINGKALTGPITLTAGDVGAATSDHTHSNYVNQNAFGQVVVNGSSPVSASSEIGDIGFKSGNGINLSYTDGKDCDIDITIKNTGVLGVKGDNEASYRSGQVNITKSDIGLGAVDNTTDMNKPVSNLQDAAIKAAESNAKSYTDEKVAALVNGAPETLDTLDELAAALKDNANIVDVLNQSIGNKSDKGHSHDDLYYAKTEIDNKVSALNTAINGKSDSGHNHDGLYYTETEIDDKVSNLNTAINGKASTSDLTTHTGNANIHFTSDERTKLSGIEAKAQVNQNAFSKVTVGTTEIVADSATDNLTIAAGTGISVTGSASDDKVTITNSGVHSISTGGSNGTISVNKNGTSTDVAVKGLGTAAYKAEGDFAPNSHGTHVTYDSTNKPKMDGTAAYGTSGSVARADHVHPTDTSRASQSDLTALTGVVNGKSDSGHTHDYAGSSSAGGAATSANKVNKSLTIKLNSGSTEGTNLFTFNGSAAKSVNITPSAIGAYTKTETYSSGEINTKLDEKVSVVSGKGLSENDFTTTLKNKLDNITVKSVAFTPSLTSGVEVGTINIDGTDTVLYCQKNTNTHYTAKNIVGNSTTQQSNSDNVSNGNVYLNLIENSKVNSSNKISGSGYTSVTATGGNITVDTSIPTASSSTLGLMSTEMATKVEGLGNVANIVYASGGTLPQATGGSAGIVHSDSSTITGFSVCPINGGKVYYKDTNTTYSAGNGISINSSNQIANTGIRTLATGSANGTVSANGSDVAVKGLGSAAYTNSTAYAPAGTYAGASEQGGKANSAATADYATSAGSAATATSATTASKLSVSAGNSSTPVYFEDGIPKECSVTDNKVKQTNETGTTGYPLLIAKTNTTSTKTEDVKKVSNATLTGTGALQITSLKIGDATLSYDTTAQALVISFS